MTDPAKVKEVVERLRIEANFIRLQRPEWNAGFRHWTDDTASRFDEARALLESLSAELTALREGGDVGLETRAEERANMSKSQGTLGRFARDIDKLLARTGQGEPQTPEDDDDELAILGKATGAHPFT